MSALLALAAWIEAGKWAQEREGDAPSLNARERRRAYLACPIIALPLAGVLGGPPPLGLIAWVLITAGLAGAVANLERADEDG